MMTAEKLINNFVAILRLLNHCAIVVAFL